MKSSKLTAFAAGIAIAIASTGAPSGEWPAIGTVYTGATQLTSEQKLTYANANMALFAQAYDASGKIKGPIASELLSWRLLYGPALKQHPAQ
jgi:hypothetical protein